MSIGNYPDMVPDDDYFNWEIEAMSPDGPDLEPIADCPGYEISSYGQVVSYKSGEPINLKTWPNQHGHQYVKIRDKDGNDKRLSVHRLVAEAFIDNPENLPVVRHMDNDPTNNEVYNLRWGTQKDNVHDTINSDRDYKKRVYCVETDTFYRSGAEAARQLGMSKASVSKLCNHIIPFAKGYHVYFSDEIDEK